MHNSYNLVTRQSPSEGRQTTRQDLIKSVTQDLRISSTADSDIELRTARSVVFLVVRSYWETTRKNNNWQWSLRRRPSRVGFIGQSSETAEWCAKFGNSAAYLDPSEAAYRIGALYTSLMPKDYKVKLGAHYTPPALSEELLEMAAENGVDWGTARILDPACGGGAFLVPIARRMIAIRDAASAINVLEDIEQSLVGYELDPFAAWLSKVFLDTVFGELCYKAGRRHRCDVAICNSLERNRDKDGFDLVIGNPPYGRIRLPQKLRAKFSRSLFGHANLYGLFTDQALRLTRKGGLIAYVTPTSFLSGEYFKSLRGLLAEEAPPVSLGFVTKRKGVFDDVLQETLLAIYRRTSNKTAGVVRLITPKASGEVESVFAGRFDLPADPKSPWLIPRTKRHSVLLRQTRDLTCRLSDFGYTVSTGPFVWNRHKLNLRARRSRGAYPVIWAEAIRAEGKFEFRASQRNHKPFFKPQQHEQWVVTDFDCVLLHRTTAIEQDRRLIAAELPNSFIAEHGAVVIENHLNMVRSVVEMPKISPKTLAAVLNSSVVDQLFRCINGSVAVSAFELKALPLPSQEDMEAIEYLVSSGAQREYVEQALIRAFGI